MRRVVTIPTWLVHLLIDILILHILLQNFNNNVKRIALVELLPEANGYFVWRLADSTILRKIVVLVSEESL